MLIKPDVHRWTYQYKEQDEQHLIDIFNNKGEIPALKSWWGPCLHQGQNFTPRCPKMESTMIAEVVLNGWGLCQKKPHMLLFWLEFASFQPASASTSEGPKWHQIKPGHEPAHLIYQGQGGNGAMHDEDAKMHHTDTLTLCAQALGTLISWQQLIYYFLPVNSVWNNQHEFLSGGNFLSLEDFMQRRAGRGGHAQAGEQLPHRTWRRWEQGFFGTKRCYCNTLTHRNHVSYC